MAFTPACPGERAHPLLLRQDDPEGSKCSCSRPAWSEPLLFTVQKVQTLRMEWRRMGSDSRSKPSEGRPVGNPGVEMSMFFFLLYLDNMVYVAISSIGRQGPFEQRQELRLCNAGALSKHKVLLPC